MNTWFNSMLVLCILKVRTCLLRTALPLSSWSLLFAWASRALASSCNMSAFLLALADSSVFLAMSSSTVLYLLFSSVLRTCCSRCKHKMEPLKRLRKGSCSIFGVSRAHRLLAQVTKAETRLGYVLLNTQGFKSWHEDWVALLQICGNSTASILGKDLQDSVTQLCNLWKLWPLAQLRLRNWPCSWLNVCV